MKKLLTLLIVLTPLYAAAQGVRHDNIAFKTAVPSLSAGVAGAVLQPIANAIVTVCSGSTLPAVGVACSPTTTVYSNIALTTVLSNPTNADGNGNYFFYAIGGLQYIVSVAGSGLTTYSYVWTAPPSLAGANSWTGAQTFASPVLNTPTLNTPTLSTPSLVSPTISGVTIDTSVYTQSGSQTVGKWNSLQVIDGTKYALTDVGLAAAITAAGTNGTVLIPPNTNVVIGSGGCPIIISNNNVSIIGLGFGSQITVNCIGDVFTGAGLVPRFDSLNIVIGASSARTGSLWNMTGSEGTVHNVRIVGTNAITNNGKIFTFGVSSANNWILNKIRVPGGVPWTYLIQFGPLASLTVGSAELSDFLVSNTITWSTGVVILDSGVDTVTMTNIQLGAGPSSTTPILWLKNTSTSSSPRWIKCTNCYLDGGTGASTGIQLDASREFRYQGYIASVKNAVVVSGAGVSETYIRHSEITNIQQHGVTIASGAINTVVQDTSFTDIGTQTTNTYDGVNIAAGATSFKVDRNNFRQIASNNARDWINVLTGASDNYSISFNNFHTNAATVNLNDGGTAPSAARSIWANLPTPSSGVEKVQSIPNFFLGAIFAGQSFFRAGITNDIANLALVGTPGVTIGGGSTFTRFNQITVTLTCSSISANSASTQSFTVTGVQAADKVVAVWNAPQGGNFSYQAYRATGANTVAIDFANNSGVSATPGCGSVTFLLFQ